MNNDDGGSNISISDGGVVVAADSASEQQQLLANNFNLFESTSPVGGGGVGQLPDLSMAQQNTWCCHLHSSSSVDCSIRLIGEVYYHVVPVKTVSRDAQQYNMQNNPNEYWEVLNSELFVSPVAYISHINDFTFFNRILIIFQRLDAHRLKYIAQNTPSDFIKRHIVCTATGSRVTLCNKHLIKSAGSSNSNASSAASKLAATTSSPTFGVTKVYSLYTRCNWIRSLLKALFPQIESTKNGVSTTIPVWAINLYHRPRNNQCFEVGPYDIGSSTNLVNEIGNNRSSSSSKRLRKN